MFIFRFFKSITFLISGILTEDNFHNGLTNPKKQGPENQGPCSIYKREEVFT
jgi:hypothetical protein